MADIPTLAGWALLVTASLAAGAVVAAWLRLPETVAAVVTSFGGGILLAAVAFELVPEADGRAGTAWTAAGLLLGAVGYVVADAWLSRDERMELTRRSGHAAAAGQPMMMSVVSASEGRDRSPPGSMPGAVRAPSATSAALARRQVVRGEARRSPQALSSTGFRNLWPWGSWSPVGTRDSRCWSPS